MKNLKIFSILIVLVLLAFGLSSSLTASEEAIFVNPSEIAESLDVDMSDIDDANAKICVMGPCDMVANSELQEKIESKLESMGTCTPCPLQLDISE